MKCIIALLAAVLGFASAIAWSHEHMPDSSVVVPPRVIKPDLDQGGRTPSRMPRAHPRDPGPDAKNRPAPNFRPQAPVICACTQIGDQA